MNKVNESKIRNRMYEVHGFLPIKINAKGLD